MMANIHYDALEKGENNCLVDVWFKTGTNRRRSWIIASSGIQYREQIPSTGDVFLWKAWLEGTHSFYPWRKCLIHKVKRS